MPGNVEIPEIDHCIFDLAPPERGWVRVNIVLGEFTLDEDVPVVFNDPIEELLDWAIFVLEGSTGYRRVCLWLEPAGYALDVRPFGPEQLQVRVSFDQAFVPPMTATNLEQRHEYVVRRSTLAPVVQRALSRLLLASRNFSATNLSRYRDKLTYLNALVRDGTS